MKTDDWTINDIIVGISIALMTIGAALYSLSVTVEGFENVILEDDVYDDLR